MKVRDNAPIKVTAVGVALICVLAGCGKDDKKEESPSSSASATSTSSAATTTEAAAPAANDYSALLISADDIEAPEPFIAGDLMQNPDGMQGIATIFHNESNTAMIGDTIVVLADPAEAASVMGKTAETLPSTTVMGTAVPSPIGSDGLLVDGTSPDGSRAVTVLLFQEQNAVVTLQFESAPGDLNPAPPDFVQSVGQLQLDAVKAGLPNITPPPPAGGAGG